MLRIVIVVGKHFAKTYGILPKKFNSPWLVRRDFNEITNASEKLRGGGGEPVKNNKISYFINFLDDMEIINLGFTR